MIRIAGTLVAFAFQLSACAAPSPPPKTVPTPAEAPAPQAPSAAAPTALPAAPASAKPRAKPSLAKAPTPVPPAAAPRKPEAEGAPQQAAKPAGPPPLDLKTLEQQLKETKAIGVLTKLSLKNQVDDLLEQFRDYYAGRLKVPLAELRRPFDMLLMKVLSLLQDKDPALAGSIHASREALWSILADREKFQKLA